MLRAMYFEVETNMSGKKPRTPIVMQAWEAVLGKKDDDRKGDKAENKEEKPKRKRPEPIVIQAWRSLKK